MFNRHTLTICVVFNISIEMKNNDTHPVVRIIVYNDIIMIGSHNNNSSKMAHHLYEAREVFSDFKGTWLLH